MNYNNKPYKDNFENIKVPIEADLIIEKAIKRAKNRHKRRFLKLSSSLAASFALLIFLGKASPAFANYINNVTAPVKNLFSNFQDKGIDNAVKNGFVQETSKDKKATDKGITVTIDQVTISGNKLNIGYTLKADDRYKDFKDLNYDKFKITDNKGRVLYDERTSDEIAKDAKEFNDKYKNKVYQIDGILYQSCEHNNINKESFKNTRIKQGIFQFASSKSKIDEIPDSITIEFYDFSDNTLGYRYNKFYGFFYKLTHKSPKFVEGNWAITVQIDDKIKNAKEIKYVKAEETTENSNIKIEYVNIYPTTTNAKFLIPKDMNITNIHLEDEKGNRYNYKGGWLDNNPVNSNYSIEGPDFESPYFDKIQNLYLVFDSKENGKNKAFKIELKRQ
ncbi:DUF4179 domain-containing protein [Clostridium sp. P21]|uniref:DUF4179 domain-containing protein n=1 Tax=Clostridium muellerianum TaxID=2716538 RepID=A0A7Y0EKF3_9CLOT|nr:DUF4179 domain-containing protein [Clostridium muellerianum]NMM65032.1 DUF4179 domain-containing protein [Clostridium muellerianum]